MEENQKISYPSYPWLPSFFQRETLVEGKPPLYFDPYSIFEARIKDLEDRIEKLEQKGEQQIIPIQFLESEKLELKQPIIVSLVYDLENEIYVVDCPELNIYGEGKDELSVIEDFKVALEEVYFDLKKDKDKLGPHLEKEWRRLSKIIKEK